MKVLLVHLSDIHLKRGNNACLSRKAQICKSFQNIALGADKVFVVITGDIAFSGSEDEYLKAKELFEFIRDAIQAYSNKQVEFVIVPGNHDCQFGTDRDEIREILVRDIQNRKPTDISDGVIAQCCEAQCNFKSFVESYNNNIVYSDKLFSVIDHHFDGHRIVFYCYNTAWLSVPEESEKMGTLYFPIKQLPTKYYDGNASLSVSLLHHPFFWHNPQNAKYLSDHLDDTSQLIITGHSHIPSKSMKDDLEGNLTEYVEGSILQGEGGDDGKSGLNMIEIDLARKTQRICQFEWNGEIYSATKDTGEMAFGQLVRRYRGAFEVDPAFRKGFLDDPGAQFRHPRKADLTIEDIFIFPHMREVGTGREELKFIYHDVKDSEVLLRIHEAGNRILLVGGEKAGKTALCKILYKNYHNQGYVPIYVRGENINSSHLEKFNKLLIRCYQEQYSSKTLEKFEQLENNKKFLIIDDYDKLKVDLKSRSILLNRLNRQYPNILITGNDLYQIGEVLAEAEQDVSSLQGYMEYSIMPFGNLLRERLIERWNSIGGQEQEYIEEAEIVHRNDETKKIVDAIIGKNLVPSYPIFLLTILQGMETGYPHKLEESSHGYCYQLLIRQDISTVTEINSKINAYYNYLAELAYFMFKNNVREISIESLSQFHEWYCTEYKVSSRFTELINLGILIPHLSEARMIARVGDIYRFRYKYIYYFFIAKYFADNLTRDDIKDAVNEMCKRLYVEDFANTVMFLTHHSKDPFVLNTVLANAKKVFSEYQPIRFEEDVSFINKLLTTLPNLVLQNRSPRDTRDESAVLKDKIEIQEEKETEKHEDLSVGQEIVELDFLSKLNLTFRLLELLGQILRNYHSSLKGDARLSICEEEYLLGLRALTPVFQLFDEHTDYLVNRIKGFVQKKGRLSPNVIEQAARKTLFGLCLFVSFGFIKKISDSVGSEYLSETYKDILEQLDTASVHLVDTSIKFDFYRGFPCNTLKKLKGKFENNVLALSILRELVVDYLYMYPIDFKHKQRIASVLDITMGEQRLIATSSTAKRISDGRQ